MSFLITAPEALNEAAAEVRNMSAQTVGAHAAADPVLTAVVAPAPDPDSQRVAAHLVQYAQQYSETIAEAAVMLDEFALALDAGAAQYATTEADNVKALN